MQAIKKSNFNPTSREGAEVLQDSRLDNPRGTRRMAPVVMKMFPPTLHGTRTERTKKRSRPLNCTTSSNPW